MAVTPAEKIAKLRAAAAAARQQDRHLPERHIDLEDELPEPPVAEQCRQCREFGSCGEPCFHCGAPIRHQGFGGWWHAHGRAEGSPMHWPRPIPRGMKG